MNFTSLHNHSEYSNVKLIDSIIKTTDLIDNAAAKGYKGVALTDHEILSGAVKAVKHYEKNKEKYPEDFKLILGNEIYLTNATEETKDQAIFPHFLLLAKDNKGFEALKELSAKAWENSFWHKGIIRTPTHYSDLQEVIAKYKGHVIGSSACISSIFANFINEYAQVDSDSKRVDDKRKRIKDYIKWFQNVFGEKNFFIEIQPNVEQTDQKIYNYHAVQIANEENVPFIVTTDSHYINKEDRGVHRNYLQSKQGDREVDEFYSSTYMMEIDEIHSALKESYLHPEDVKQAIENTMKIHEMIEGYELEQDIAVTKIKPFNFNLKHILENYYDSYPYIKSFAYSEYEQDRFLLHQIEQGLTEKYNDNFTETEVDRINTELEELWHVSEKINARASAYYNTAQKLIDILWSEGDSLVGPGRGSVTGFFICYLTDITQMNPIDWGLPHWRHLSKERPEMPDIDIDSQATKREAIHGAIEDFFGNDRVLPIATFGTESTKSAVLTACRGLGIDVDVGTYLTSLIPVDRGFNWTIQDCLEGNEEKGRKPIPAFKKEIEKHPQLKETILKIEGLVNKRSVHASGIYVYNNNYLNYNTKMRAPSGEFTTQFDMEDSDYMGGMKFDFLTIKALDKIRITLDHLIYDGYIEEKENLLETYKHSIHPDNLDYNSKEMWKMVGNNEIIDLFQFDSEVGIQAVKAVKPQSLEELCAANCLMRLAGGEKRDGKTPIEEYIQHKKDISQWYKEMEESGLSEEEQQLLSKHISHVYGIADTQEVVMQLVIDEDIAGFDLVEANKLRKAIGKKDEKTMKEVRAKFFEKGKEKGVSDNLLDYIWNVQIKRQLGYSFSRNHSMPYSLIALQQLNLCYYYPSIYWSTACLTVNSGSSDEGAGTSTDYGKIASAIGTLQEKGIKVGLPNINKAKFSFTPDVDNNQILFGLKAVNRIGDDLALTIIDNRFYEGLDDFLQKVKVNKTHAIQLIKSGAFDEVEERSRKDILADYISKICGKKNKITLQNFNMLCNYDLIPQKFDFHKEIYYFTKYLRKQKSGEYYLFDNYAQQFYENNDFDSNLLEIQNGQLMIPKNKWEKIYNQYMNEIRKYFKENQEELLEKLNNAIFQEEWEKYGGNDNISAWEMEAISFYYHDHELKQAKLKDYNIIDFFSLPREPIVDQTFYKNGKEITMYKLHRIAGTVLEKEKTRHIVTLLTLNGVVHVKFFRNQFAYYDKQISVPDPNVEGKKKVVEKSWFQKGNKLIITGIRQGDTFMPKRYKNSIYQHVVMLIDDIKPNGEISVVTERVAEE